MAQTKPIPDRVICSRSGLVIDLDQTETAPCNEDFFWWYCPACQDWHPTGGGAPDPVKLMNDKPAGENSG